MRYLGRIGNVFDDVGGAIEDAADAVADVATSVVDDISDAGHAIGAVLKFIAPIVALWPGIGTGLAIALEAAGAYAAGDKIEDAIIETTTAAIPGGVPRVAFAAAADITETAIKGGNVGNAVIGQCRNLANSVGGERAVGAFDAGLAVARGDKVNGAMWKLARGTAAQGGPVELAAFDASYAIAQGGNALDATRAIARDYFGQMGGPLAAAAFEAGVSIATGKSIQDAGFAALAAFVAGNDLGERAVAFADAMTRAAQSGQPIGAVVRKELETDAETYGRALSRSGAGDGAKALFAEKLGPILDGWKDEWAALGSYQLGDLLGVDEIFARAGQAIMRDVAGGGEPDYALAAQLMQTGIQMAIDRFGPAFVASTATNLTYAQTKADLRQDELTLAARLPAVALSYGTALAQAQASGGALRQTVAPSALRATVPSVPDPAPVAVAPAPVAAPAPAPSSSSMTPANIALGGGIAVGLVALVWWATK